MKSKKKKFLVSIDEVAHYSVVVEAYSEHEAQNVAMEKHGNGELDASDWDIEDVYVKELGGTK